MRMYDIIDRKKKGGSLSGKQIAYFVKGAADGSIPDCQTSALLMAILLKGMDTAETTALTLEMANSGLRETRPDVDGIICDKHSTGGVSDSTTLIVVPVLSALGLKCAKLSGRGLGHTGGTLDKLESFDGFNTALTGAQFTRIVKQTGAAIAGQTGQIVPADKKLYALRDVTATVDSLPLIASSIMSKKLASFADVIMLDVKYGSGAFMKTKSAALNLARLMVEIGNNAGRKTAALITDMNSPLGDSVGCDLEVAEAVEVLKGKEQGALKEVSLELAARTYALAFGADYIQSKALCQETIFSGAALKKLKEIVAAQGGSFERFENFSPKTAQFTLKSKESGIITAINTENIGKANVALGGGRVSAGDGIDHSVGIVVLKRAGDKVSAGTPLAHIYHNAQKGLKEAQELILDAYKTGARFRRQKSIYAYADKNGTTVF